jgi:hypothetical protein
MLFKNEYIFKSLFLKKVCIGGCDRKPVEDYKSKLFHSGHLDYIGGVADDYIGGVADGVGQLDGGAVPQVEDENRSPLHSHTRSAAPFSVLISRREVVHPLGVKTLCSLLRLSKQKRVFPPGRG